MGLRAKRAFRITRYGCNISLVCVREHGANPSIQKRGGKVIDPGRKAKEPGRAEGLGAWKITRLLTQSARAREHNTLEKIHSTACLTQFPGDTIAQNRPRAQEFRLHQLYYRKSSANHPPTPSYCYYRLNRAIFVYIVYA